MIRSKYASDGIRHCFFAFSAILWLGCLLPLNLMAQTDSLKKAEELKEVKINAIKLGKRQLSASPLQILSGEQLEKLNSLSVADAVRYFSGVQLKDYGGIGGLKTINVRSMGTNHTGVFYDGVELGNAQNGQVDLGKFSLDNIEEIELYNGQKSTIFQSAKGFASGNSLYLNSKQPVFEKGVNNHFKAVVKTGSFALIDPALLWQTKISDKIYGTISAEYKNSDGKYKFKVTDGVYDSTLVRKDGDLQSMRIEGGLNGKLPDSSAWSAKVYFYKDEQGLPGAIVGNKYRFSQRAWNKNFFVQSTYKKEAGDYNFMAIAKYANDYLRFLDPEIVNVDGLLENTYKQQELYLSLANRYKINSFWSVVLSTDYQYSTLDANLYRFPYPSRNTFLMALATQLHWEKLDIQANLLNTYVNDRVKQYTSAGNKQELTPTIMVSWQPFELKEFRIRSFYKDIFRMPTFNDLYYTAIGSVDLKPEYTKQYDLGLTYIKDFEDKLLKEISVQTDVYYNKVKDKIIAVPSANLIKWSMQNVGLVDIRGLDLNVQTAWRISNAVSLNTGLTYTHQRALDVTKNGVNYREQLAYTPVNSGSFTAGADWKKFAFNYSYIYTGQRYNQNANNETTYVLPWYTHDIAFNYTEPLKKGKFKISAEVNNLLNQSYEVITNFPMPGRYYRLGLAYSY